MKMELDKKIAGTAQASFYLLGVLVILTGILTDRWVDGILGIAAIATAYTITTKQEKT